MPDFKGSLLELLNPANLGFIVAYLGVGRCRLRRADLCGQRGLDPDDPGSPQTDAITASLTSLRLVLTQPLVMRWWGALITALVALALLPWFLGLFIVGPIVGHASWHAYRAAVADDSAPLR